MVEYFSPQNYAFISNWLLYFLERKQETSVEAGGVTHDENSYMCSEGVQIQEIQIDGLKSQLNNKQRNFSDDNFASLNECL